MSIGGHGHGIAEDGMMVVVVLVLPMVSLFFAKYVFIQCVHASFALVFFF